MMKYGAVVFTLVLATACAQNQSSGLNQLFEEYWDFYLTESPLFATQTGDLRFNDKLPDESLAAYERRNQRNQDFLSRLETFEKGPLSDEDRLNLLLLKKQLQSNVEEYRFKAYLEPVDQRTGFLQYLPEIHERIPFDTEKQYHDYITRLKAVPAFIEQEKELMRKGLAEKVTPPQLVLNNVPDQINVLLAVPPEEFPLYEPFLSIPKVFSAESKAALKKEGLDAITNTLYPALTSFKAFLADEYIPKASTDIAASTRYPDGAAFYDYRIRMYTTTELTAQEIHDIGLREVERIQGEMDAVIKETGFKGTFAEFVDFLRTDPRFYYDDPDELLRDYRDICKRMDAELPRLFGKLPRTPYGVREVPAYQAPSATTAYYNQPSPDGRQPGWFYANTYALKSRPKYEMEALSFHESVPGHHLQIALQMELENVPAFRTLATYTAFVEGWGLYAESLGPEVGFYETSYSRFGALSYEMWRALRLVVDTGMHRFGWSRKKAIDYMLAHSALTRTNVENEVDRYISWPGQALAYKIGQIKIRELRMRATRELGENFDVRAFHDAVLEAGAIPLDTLESRIEAWIDAQAKHS